MEKRLKRYVEEVISKRKLCLEVVVVAVVLTIFISWLFYDSVYGLVLFPVILIGSVVYLAGEEVGKEREFFLKCYQEFLGGITSWLSTGLSIEVAFMKEEEALAELFGANAEFVRGISKVNQEVALNKPIEKAFYDFAYRNDLEEVWEFAEVFVFSKRLGADYVSNIRKCTDRMNEMIEIRRQIAADSYEKNVEMKIMCAVPLLFIAFLKTTSYEFISVLYSNLAGVVVMTVAFGIYVISASLAVWIVRKEGRM